MFNAESQALYERLQRNQAILEGKIAEPSRKLSLEEVSTLVEKLNTLISEANTATIAHNETVANISSEKRILVAQVWRYVLNELSDAISDYDDKKLRLTRANEGMKESLRTKNNELRGLQAQVKEYERQSTSVHPTKDAINNLLQAFGFNSFHIEVVDEFGHYRIVRENGEDASRSLSEGEKTFITLLYILLCYFTVIFQFYQPKFAAHRCVNTQRPLTTIDHWRSIMAKRNSKLDTHAGKGKKSAALKRKSLHSYKKVKKPYQKLCSDCYALLDEITRVQGLIQNQPGGEQKSNKPEANQEPKDSDGFVLSADFELTDPNRHNAFIGELLMATLKNVIAGLALLFGVLQVASKGLSLPQSTCEGILLMIENRRRALTLKRESELGGV